MAFRFKVKSYNQLYKSIKQSVDWYNIKKITFFFRLFNFFKNGNQIKRNY